MSIYVGQALARVSLESVYAFDLATGDPQDAYKGYMKSVFSDMAKRMLVDLKGGGDLLLPSKLAEPGKIGVEAIYFPGQQRSSMHLSVYYGKGTCPARLASIGQDMTRIDLGPFVGVIDDRGTIDHSWRCAEGTRRWADGCDFADGAPIPDGAANNGNPQQAAWILTQRKADLIEPGIYRFCLYRNDELLSQAEVKVSGRSRTRTNYSLLNVVSNNQLRIDPRFDNLEWELVGSQNHYRRGNGREIVTHRLSEGNYRLLGRAKDRYGNRVRFLCEFTAGNNGQITYDGNCK